VRLIFPTDYGMCFFYNLAKDSFACFLRYCDGLCQNHSPHDDAADFECEGASAERGLLGAVVLLK
jgi:hypothetical protein